LPSEFKNKLALEQGAKHVAAGQGHGSIIKILDLAVVLLFLVFYQFGYPSIQYSSHHQDYHIFKKSY